MSPTPRLRVGALTASPILACEWGLLLVPQSSLASGGPYLFPKSSLASGGSYLFPNPRLRVGLLLVLRVWSVNVILCDLSERALLWELVSSLSLLFSCTTFLRIGSERPVPKEFSL